MLTLLLSILYILIFEVFQLDLFYFTFGISALAFYRLHKGEAVHILGYLNLFETKYTKQNILGWIACFIFFGYYFWRTGQLIDVETFIGYIGFVIFCYFISFQDGTKGQLKFI